VRAAEADTGTPLESSGSYFPASLAGITVSQTIETDVEGRADAGCGSVRGLTAHYAQTHWPHSLVRQSACRHDIILCQILAGISPRHLRNIGRLAPAEHENAATQGLKHCTGPGQLERCSVSGQTHLVSSANDYITTCCQHRIHKNRLSAVLARSNGAVRGRLLKRVYGLPLSGEAAIQTPSTWATCLR
jgi:hypothetical protein